MLKRMETKLLELLDVAALPIKPTYTVSETSIILGVTGRSIRRMIEQNKLSSIRLNGHHRVPYVDILRYIFLNDNYNRDCGYQKDLFELFTDGINKLPKTKDYTTFLERWMESQIKERI